MKKGAKLKMFNSNFLRKIYNQFRSIEKIANDYDVHISESATKKDTFIFRVLRKKDAYKELVFSLEEIELVEEKDGSSSLKIDYNIYYFGESMFRKKYDKLATYIIKREIDYAFNTFVKKYGTENNPPQSNS